MNGPVLFVADNASQISPAKKVAEALSEARGVTSKAILVGSQTRYTPEQMSEFGLADLTLVDSIDLLLETEEIFSASAIVAFITGSSLHKFLYRFRQTIESRDSRSRPVVVTGYNGVVYEKHIEGALWRTGSDLIALNSQVDQDILGTAFESLGIDPDPFCVAGPLLGQRISGDLPTTSNARRILFATQAVVPRTPRERLFLMLALREFAARNPDRELIIKPRTRPGERTFYVERQPLEPLYQSLAGRPPRNLRFEYGALSDYFEQVDLVISISSTATFEALAHGTAAGILSDFGVKESLGNHYFVGSGLITSLQRLEDHDYPNPNLDWFRRNGWGPDDTIANLTARFTGLVQKQEKIGQRLEFQPQFYSARNAQFVQRSTEGLEITRVVTAGHLWAKLKRNPMKFFRDLAPRKPNQSG